MIFDPAKSRKEEKGMIQELPFRGRPIIPEVKDELVNGVWPQFIKTVSADGRNFLGNSQTVSVQSLGNLPGGYL